MSFQIWAVLNLTPDSFYQGSIVSKEDFLHRASQFLEMGADVLDIGAESSRPFSKPISWEEEWNRLYAPLNDLKKILGKDDFFNKVSVDTYKPEITKKCLQMGVGIINDISGLKNNKMLDLISDFSARVVIMHSKGTPKNMQINPIYTDVVSEVLEFLHDRSKNAIQKGVLAKNIIWDYGIGFGKTVEHNLELLKNSYKFKRDGYSLMAGISRKSFIGKILGLTDTDQRGPASLILNTYLVLKQWVDILRVHDVKEIVQMRTLLKELDAYS